MSVKSFILKVIRNALGLVFVFSDWLTRPKPTKRSQEQQTLVQQKLTGHSLYQFYACPFCVKTRRAIHTLGIDIELKDINKDVAHRADLENGGGRVKVPCLRIEEADQVKWMYESNDIINYLQEKTA